MTRGPQYRVDRVEILGNASVPLTELEPALRLRAGAPFSESKLDADLSTIEDLYHRRGFVAGQGPAGGRAQRAAAAGVVPLRVRIVIAEGPRTVVAAVRMQGDAVGTESAWQEGLGLQPGRPYIERQLVLDRDALQLQYVNLGYPTAIVDASPGFSSDRTTAQPTFTVHLGPRILVDHVLIVGNVRTSTETIERELQVKPGDPLSEAAKIESRRRLAALGLFRRVQITELAHGDEGKRDVLVTVEESLATTVVFGAGAEGRLRDRSQRRRRRRGLANVWTSRREGRSRSRGGTCSGRTARSASFRASACTSRTRMSSIRMGTWWRADRRASRNIACSAPTASRACSGRTPTRSSPGQSSSRCAPASISRVAP